MGGVEIRELECFLVLADELHFGRAGARLYVSQGRVSQLLAALEQRIGARLVERTSRRVRLTPLGERFRAELSPAYAELAAVVDRAKEAARGVEGRLRIGFQGTADARLMEAITTFRKRHPACVTEIAEVPFADPFGAVRQGEVDAAIVLLPVAEPDLVLGPLFSRQQQTVAVSVRHPFAGRERLAAAELGGMPLIAAGPPAPAYWREAHAPSALPAPAVRTLQEGLTLVAADQGAMLLCRPTAAYHGREDVVFVPVDGVPDSVLGMVWHRDGETERVRAFARAVAAATVPAAAA
ncbi:LysR family transcriptional regulator [Streptomyces spectabilis]|uniref:DNA-binding transcriptional LysR family regulator n=1 Tax=Streptomyces spectabilis TaxID=68270 RepID=A0A5P2X4W1_STRST|nr:LysR family transcriptional regulator [Streptomyces spectabilis]MBB5109114.1 DNA-binding transcriptional LysR family regulator [Streptomyces spectabilis]MCI3902756.1 LysR family transcriptional regulator [Streptomyces spectabilis]QEV60053.1 LysR family transcriptional regulator [Streptomyces spectabilis]GGV44798.1 LysR family transcriptional regulator [Streptomyces spectabilis]